MKSKGIILICVILIFTLMGCTDVKSRTGSIIENEKNIVSLKINFEGNTMFRDGKYYEVDKNIFNDLKDIYNKI